MRTVGQILKDERSKKGFTLTQIEKATKIRAKFLISLEEDSYKNMPSFPYVQGFLKNYSDFLGLRTHTLLALFRRQFAAQEKQVRRNLEQPLTESTWRITPNKVIMVVVVILIISLFGYFYMQYRSLHQPPPLTIESPADQVIVKSETIPLFGDTDPDATLTINGEPLLVKDTGKFYKDMPLSVGGNTLTIEAKSRVGEKTTVVRRVNRTE